MSNGLFDAFRVNGGPTIYPPLKTAWQADILESGLIFAFCILAFSFYIILPGVRGKEKFFMFIRITLSLFVGAVILLTNFSYSWETAQINTLTKYKAGIAKDITADIGVHIGLRGINITLKGVPEQQINETINYNEHFSWEWRQGRLGFGPYAGRFNQEYRSAQLRGLPLPILWIAEYFTFDGEGIRWGRHYRLAGWYAHIMLWLAFPMWLLTNILFFVLLRFGAYFLAMTGTCMIIANIIWASIRNVNELKIPFSAENILDFTFGGSFWICLITGILCVVSGIAIVLLDCRKPSWMATFFGVDVLQDEDDAQEDDGEVENKPSARTDNTEMKEFGEEHDQGGNGKGASKAGGRAPLKPPMDDRKPKPVPGGATNDELNDDDELYEDKSYPVQQPVQSKFEKKSRGLTKRFQVSRRRPPPPPPPTEPTEDELYVNQAMGTEASDVRVSVAL